ncbi:MAG: efflux RND transporter periplasmic adaptor subunit, partial [Planctomycetota bacterium]
MKTERGIVRLPSHRAPSILPLWLALVAAAVLAPSPAGARAQGPPAQPVIVDRVRLEEVQERRLVTGEIRAVRRSRVAAEEGGIVIELPVREGERVERGDLLARLDGSRLALELKILEGEKEAAAAIRDERQADVEQKRRDLESLRALSERGATNPKELADAESAWKIAGARRAQADEQVRVIEARAALLGDRIADTEIRAPFDGAVVARHTELGEWLAEGDPVVEILSTGTVEAWLAVPQKHLGAVLAERHPIPLQIEATGASPQADSIRVIPLVDPRARTVPRGAPLANPHGRRAPGMSG